MLGARRPDFTAVAAVTVVAAACRRRAQAERVGARRRLGDAEGLQAKLAARDARQIARFLLGVAVPEHRSHGVHLRMAGGAVAARRLDLLHDGDGRAHGQPAAAILFRNEGCEKAGLGQGGDEFFRISALAIERPPILAGKTGAQRAHRLANRSEVGAFAHGFTSARPLLTAMTSRSTTLARKLTTAPSRHISVRSVSPGNTGAEKRQANDASLLGS